MKVKLLSIIVMGAAITLPLTAQSDVEEEDKPGRGVARISLIHGDVTVKRGDSGDTTAAAINAPLVVQDRVFTGPSSRAELQFDYSNMVRMAANTEVHLAEIEQRRYMVQVARGLVTFRVLRDQNAEVELSTPSISLRPLKRGTYRVEVREDGSTEVAVRSGEAEIYTPKGAERLKAGRTLVARGSADSAEFRDGNDLPLDDWDQWNLRRDRELERASSSYRYMSTDINGGEDLDDHGRWVNVPEYGNVWTPRVAAGWAPYQQGRWVWIDFYGWTWVSYDPWGWAPYHYGRWFHQANYGWCWWPGGMGSRHWWRPALVGFFGWNSYNGFSAGVGFGFGRIGWTPLAPYERFRPWYGHRSYGGYRNNTYIDNSVRVVNNVNITNVYRNARVRNGVSGAEGSDFVAGRGNRIRSFGDGDLRGASSIQGRVPMVPDRQSLRMADREVTQRGGAGGDNGRFVTRRQPAQVERASFDEQRRGMEQVTRRTFGGDGTRGGAAAAATAGGGADSVRVRDSGGWRSVGESGRRAAGDAATVGTVANGDSGSGRSRDNGGWRSVGESGRRSASDAGTPANSGDAGAGAGRSRDNGGWRSVGESGRRSTNEGATVSNGDAGSGRSRDNGGWRTFGDTGRRSSGDASGGTISNADTDSGRSRDSVGGRGAGEPGPRSSSDADASRGTGSGRGRDLGGGWRSFGEPTTRTSSDSGRGAYRSGDSSVDSSGSPRSNERGNSGWRSPEGSTRSNSGSEDRGRGSRSSSVGGGSDVQVNPPIVRDRGGDWGRSERSNRRERYSEAPRDSGRSMPSWGGSRSAGGDSGGGRNSDSGRSMPSWGGGGGGRGSDVGGGGRSSGGDSGRSAPSWGGGGGRGSDGGGGGRSSGGGGGRGGDVGGGGGRGGRGR